MVQFCMNGQIAVSKKENTGIRPQTSNRLKTEGICSIFSEGLSGLLIFLFRHTKKYQPSEPAGQPVDQPIQRKLSETILIECMSALADMTTENLPFFTTLA
ncbi:hypothetical protein CUROG_00560 [Corynebacterium urogenitale]|uniref:Uncharacterized protein n=1 Tax=Corynebacterium urogenitale TaxID=2487892 RepID=A0A5J6Z3B3_9CORY|nr:hypothetical protein CUROG_00560 [Corynebacterium urogenitale]